MSKGRRFTASLEVPSLRHSPTSISSPVLVNSTGHLVKNSAKKRSPSESTIPAPPIVVASSNSSSSATSLGYAPITILSEAAEKSAEKVSQSHAAEMADMKEEIARLQEREAALSHMLSLEKEQRVKAEQLVEVERMACLELKHRLHAEGKQGGGGGEEGSRDSSTNEEDEDDVDFAKLNNDVTDMLNKPAGEGSEVGDGRSVLLSPFQEEFDFSSSVFGQLTRDLQKILQVGNDHTPQSSFSQALEAVKANDPQLLQKLVPILEPLDGFPLMKIAAEKGFTSCVRVLLAQGTKFNVEGTKPEETTPLHLAAKNSHKRSLTALLKHGVHLDPTDYDGHTPLFLALRAGHAECAERLLEAGASLEIVAKSGQTVLHAAVIGQLPHSLRSIITKLRVAVSGSKFKELLNHKDEDNRTALHTAVAKGFRSCTEVLCSCEELELMQRDRWNRTPLDMASGDLKDVLLNRESKSVALCIKLTSHHLPRTTWAMSHEPPTEGAELVLTVATLDILRYHRLSDVELLVSNALQQFSFFIDNTRLQGSVTPPNETTRGCGFDDAYMDLSDRVRKRFELAKLFMGGGPVLKSGSKDEGNRKTENGNSELSGGTENEIETSFNELESRRMTPEAYVSYCRNVLWEVHSHSGGMELSGDSIESFTVGELSWKAGELSKRLHSKNLLSLLGESPGMDRPDSEENQKAVYITLKGTESGSLDELSLKLMIPASELREQLQVLENRKKLLIHGPQGSGKSHLARAFADHIKNTRGPGRTPIIHTCVHSTFERGDLFLLLHSNGLLLPAAEGGVTARGGVRGRGVQTSEESLSSSGSCVVILDELSAVGNPSLLAELLSILESRGSDHTLWLNEVLSNDGTEVLYPGGLYYLTEECYVIATWTTGFGVSLPLVAADQFPHVTLGLTQGPGCDVLRRHLMTSVIHLSKGVWPSVTQPLYRLVRWVSEIWVLYKNFLEDLCFSSVATGLRHFLSCPVNSAYPGHDIPEWLDSIWHHHLVPAVEYAFQETLGLRCYQTQENPQEMVSQLLQSLIGLVLLPTCPLSVDERENFLTQLSENLDTFFFMPTQATPLQNAADQHGGGGGRARSNAIMNRIPSPTKSVPSSFGGGAGGGNGGGSSSLPHFPPVNRSLLSHRRGSLQNLNSSAPLLGGRLGMMKKGTPHLTERRGSLSDLRFAPSFRPEKKAENIVSFEDMIRNSPNAKKRLIEKKDGSGSPSSRKGSLEDIEGEEEGKAGDKKEGVANKALKKLRSKTISLFSKDGSGTLPRLFRRGSRASLVSVSEEDPRNPFSPLSAKSPRGLLKPDFTQSLDDATDLTNLYEMLNSAQSASSSPPDEGSGGDEGQGPGHTHQRAASDDATTALNELDNFLDLLSTTDRIETQRSPLPFPSPVRGKDDDVIGTGTPKGKSHSVPKYYISTSKTSTPASSAHYQEPKFKGGSLEEVDEYSDSESSPDATDPSNMAQGHTHHGHAHQQDYVYHRKSYSYDIDEHDKSCDQPRGVGHSGGGSFRPASSEDLRNPSSAVMSQSGERYWLDAGGVEPQGGTSHYHHHQRDGSYNSQGSLGSQGSDTPRECRRVSENIGLGRPTSPLAMTSYSSQGHLGSPEEQNFYDHSSLMSRQPSGSGSNPKYFTYQHHHASRNQSNRSHKYSLQPHHHQQRSPPNIEADYWTGRSASSDQHHHHDNVMHTPEGDTLSPTDSSQMGPRVMSPNQQKIQHPLGTSSQKSQSVHGRGDHPHSPQPRSPSPQKPPHPPHRKANLQRGNSQLTRGRYVNVNIRNQYRARTASQENAPLTAGEAKTHSDHDRGLTTSYSENRARVGSVTQSQQEKFLRQRMHSYGSEHRHGVGWNTRNSSSDPNIPSAVLFSASLGFLGPESVVVTSPDGSRDRIHSQAEPEEEIL